MRRQLRRLLPATGFSRSVMLLAGGTGTAQLITILAAPALTRLYTPEQFGLLAAFSSTLAITSIVSSLRYEMGIPLPASEGEAVNVLVLALAINVIVSGLAALVVWVCGAALMALIGAPDLVGYLWLFPIGILGAGAYRALTMWFVRSRAYRTVAVSRVKQALSSTGVQLLLGLFQVGTIGLLIGQVLSQAAGVRRLARLFWQRSSEPIDGVAAARLRDVAKRYSSLAALSSGSALLNTASVRLPAMLVVAFFGPAVGGLYYLTQRVVGLPSKVIGQAVQKAYFGEFAQLLRRQPAESVSLYWRVVRMQSAMAVPAMLLIGLPAPWLFARIFGAEWREAGIYVLILMPMFAMRFVSTPLSSTLVVIERHDVFLYREFLQLVLIVGALIAGKYLEMRPRQAIACLSVTGSLGYAMHIPLTWVALRRYLRALPAESSPP